jgi:hypothetical protein
MDHSHVASFPRHELAAATAPAYQPPGSSPGVWRSGGTLARTREALQGISVGAAAHTFSVRADIFPLPDDPRRGNMRRR